MEAKVMVVIGSALLVIGVVAFIFPRLLAVPLGIILIWLSISLFVTAYRYWTGERKPAPEIPKRDDH